MQPAPSRLVVLGNPENRRVHLFADAYHAAGGRDLAVVPWADFLREPKTLRTALSGGASTLRIESPGENFEVERALLALGAREPDDPPYRELSPRQLAGLRFMKGRILPLRQWYLGWRGALGRVMRVLEQAPSCHAMNPPAEIAAMFDKARCHELLREAAVPVPRLLGLPASHDELRHLMQAHGCRRVFLKPCHSSSASGVVAFESGRDRQQAFSSVEMVRTRGRLVLFNSLRVRRYEQAGEIATLLDALCRERCVLEAWFPKASFDGLRFDLRVLVIAGHAAHVVMRQSAGPITNLHLGNRRGDVARLRARMGEEHWQAAMAVCERAAGAFPGSLYVAVDLMVASSLQRFAVAEVNAFGDLLPNLLHGGLDSYGAELQALMRQPPHVSKIGR